MQKFSFCIISPTLIVGIQSFKVKIVAIIFAYVLVKFVTIMQKNYKFSYCCLFFLASFENTGCTLTFGGQCKLVYKSNGSSTETHKSFLMHYRQQREKF